MYLRNRPVDYQSSPCYNDRFCVMFTCMRGSDGTTLKPSKTPFGDANIWGFNTDTGSENVAHGAWEGDDRLLNNTTTQQSPTHHNLHPNLQHGHSNSPSSNRHQARRQPTRRARKHRHTARTRARRITTARPIRRRTTTRHRHEIRTRNPRRIPRMQHHGQRAKERGAPLLSAEEVVDVASAEATRGGNLAVLASEVADLAVLRGGGVAGVEFACVLGVEVAEGGGAVSIRRDGEGVDVVREGAVGGLVGQVGDVDGELDARGGTDGGDGAGDGAADVGVEHEGGEGRDVGVLWLGGLRGCGPVDGRVAGVYGELVDDGAFKCVDAGERGAAGFWDDGEDAGFGCCEEHG